MKEKEKWARDFAKRQLTDNCNELIRLNSLEAFIEGFDLAKEEMLKRLSMPANYGIKEIMNLGDKEIENRP